MLKPLFVLQLLFLHRYFKIDDSECTSPGAIDGVMYFNQYVDAHYPMQGSLFCIFIL